MRRFRDRVEAGRLLAVQLGAYANRDDIVVLALPRGGVPVGHEVARALGAPLDVLLVRKLGLPGQEELAIGALASGGTRVVNEELVEHLGLSEELIDRVAAGEAVELERRERLYRDDRPARDVAGRVVVLVDDGLATGSTMHAAAVALRSRSPSRVVVAVPTGSVGAVELLGRVADEVVCLASPEPFYAVGMSYDDFSEVNDDEVRALLSGS